MDEDGGIEIDDILRDLGRSPEHPVADDDVSADDEAPTAAAGTSGSTGGSSTKYKLIKGLVAVTAIAALTIGASLGLSAKKNQGSTLTSANKALTLEECLAREEYHSYSISTDMPTEIPTSLPTKSPEVDLDDYFPIADDNLFMPNMDGDRRRNDIRDLEGGAEHGNRRRRRELRRREKLVKKNSFVRTGRSTLVEKRKLVRLGSSGGDEENHTSKKVGVLRERVST